MERFTKTEWTYLTSGVIRTITAQGKHLNIASISKGCRATAGSELEDPYNLSLILHAPKMYYTLKKALLAFSSNDEDEKKEIVKEICDVLLKATEPVI